MGLLVMGLLVADVAASRRESAQLVTVLDRVRWSLRPARGAVIQLRLPVGCPARTRRCTGPCTRTSTPARAGSPRHQDSSYLRTGPGARCACWPDRRLRHMPDRGGDRRPWRRNPIRTPRCASDQWLRPRFLRVRMQSSRGVATHPRHYRNGVARSAGGRAPVVADAELVAFGIGHQDPAAAVLTQLAS